MKAKTRKICMAVTVLMIISVLCLIASVNALAAQVEQEPNNTFSQANELYPDSAMRGTNTYEDRDYFKFTIGNSQDVTIRIACKNDDIGITHNSDLALYTSSGSELRSTNKFWGWFSGYTGDVLLWNDTLGPGTYYVFIGYGNYEIEYEITASFQPSITGELSVSGEYEFGKTLQATYTGNATNFSYQWCRDSEPVGNDSSYTLTGQDVGHKISVSVTAPEYYGELCTEGVEVKGIQISGTAKITGTAKYKEKLILESEIMPENATVQYQWYRDGEAIDGADQKNYICTAKDTDSQVWVEITGKDGYTGKISTEKVKVEAISVSGNAEIVGDAKVGESLRVEKNLLPLGAVTSYTWLVDSRPVEGENEITYIVRKEDVNKKISVLVVGTDGYSCEIYSNELLAEKNEISGEITVKGDAVYGNALAVNTSGMMPEHAAIEYKWMRNGIEISAADSAQYVVSIEDIGQKISVEISGIEGYFGTLTSDEVVPSGIDIYGSLVIDGVFQVGETVKAELMDCPSDSSPKYVWLKNGEPIQNENADSLLLTDDFADAYVTVEVQMDGYSNKLASDKTKIHKFGKWENYDENSHCKRCDCSEIITESHVLNYSSSKDATCTEDGNNEYATCSLCGYSTYEKIPALGHDEEVIPAVAATCAKIGLTAGKRCTRCNEILVAQHEIAKTAHTWDNGTVTSEPQVGVAGEKTFTCTVCSETRTEEIAPSVPTVPARIVVKSSGSVKELTDGIVGAVHSVTVAELLASSNASYIVDKDGNRVADTAPLATGMKIILESGDKKLEKTIAVFGDVDGDGVISVTDARAALRAAVGLDTLEGAYLDAARVNGTDKVAVTDARAILRTAVALDTGKDWFANIK